jgi:hypothetical protein
MNSLSKRSNTVSRTTTAALCVLVPGFVFVSCGESHDGLSRREPTGGTSGAAGEVSEGGSGGSGTGASGAGGKGGTTAGKDAGGSDAGSGGTTGGEGADGGSAGSGGAGAGGCEGAGCGGDVCPTELRCNGVCCGAPPPNATAMCEGDACAARCNTNFHACGSTNSPPCYAEDDVQHCGTSCVDCRQPNATFRCENGACQNACTGLTLACTPTNGKPTCASWDFESGTSEGWFIGNHLGGTNRSIPSGFTGLFETRTAHATRGSWSLAVGFQGEGFDYWLAELRIRLCQDSQPLDLSGLTLKFDVYAETAPGAQPFNYQSRNYVVLFNENQPPGYEQVFAACDWDGEPDEPMSVSCDIYNTSANATEMAIFMRVFEPWRGIYYFDNIRLEPTPPPEP